MIFIYIDFDSGDYQLLIKKSKKMGFSNPINLAEPILYTNNSNC